VANRAGLLPETGRSTALDRALMADSAAIFAGSLLGTTRNSTRMTLTSPPVSAPGMSRANSVGLSEGGAETMPNVILVLFLVELFDATGTLMAVANRAGLLPETGRSTAISARSSAVERPVSGRSPARLATAISVPVASKIKAALLLTILTVTGLSFVFAGNAFQGIVSAPPSLSPTLFALDIPGALTGGPSAPPPSGSRARRAPCRAGAGRPASRRWRGWPPPS
jgi:xanthine/uracil/vitamin C permease (AzgA family)